MNPTDLTSQPMATPEITTDQAKDWLENGLPIQGMFATRVTITPELAQLMLQRNDKNRPVRAGHVHNLMSLIQRGEFKLTHQGLAFRPDGRLHDGQHRLMAISMAKLSVTMLVTWNVPPETMGIIDTGAKRTYGDVLALHGYSDATNLAAIANILRRYRTGTWHNRQPVSADQLIETVEAEPGVMEHMTEGRKMNANLGIPRTVAAVALYLTRNSAVPDPARSSIVPKEEVEEWISQVIEGEMLRKGMPAYHLRAYFLNRRMNKIRMTHKDVLGAYARGWYAFTAGREIGNIRWLDSEPVPDIENPPMPRRRRKKD